MRIFCHYIWQHNYRISLFLVVIWLYTSGAIDQNQHDRKKKEDGEGVSATVSQHKSDKQEPKQTFLHTPSSNSLDDVTVTNEDENSNNNNKYDSDDDEDEDEDLTASFNELLSKNKQFKDTSRSGVDNDNSAKEKNRADVLNNVQVIKIQIETDEDGTVTTTTTTEASPNDMTTDSADTAEKRNDERKANSINKDEGDGTENFQSDIDSSKYEREHTDQTSSNVKHTSTTAATEELEEDDDNEQNEPITPELELAQNFYNQAMKLINGTKRHYDEAYKLFLKAADLGSIEAKEELAMAHLIGEHLLLNFTRARLYFEEGILQGSPRSHFGLSFMHSVGLIANASIPKALIYLTFSAIDGDSFGQMALGYRYWRSVGVYHSCESALLYYKQVATEVASKITSSSGQLIQRIRLYDEEENPSQNNIMVDDDLLQYYQLLADRGDIQAQYGLGQLYYLRDTAFDRALHYFRLAAEGGNSNAMAYLGKLYSEKNDYIKQNNITALNYFQKSAEKNNPMGQAGVGTMYYHGAGVEKNFEKALKYFQLSSDQGYAEGQLMLGIMYYNGEGVKRDYKMAVKYFSSASQSGHALGYYNLAQMHSSGTGVLRSCTTAVELFKNVAERGRWSSIFIEAYNLYKQGHIDQALGKYLLLAELGYEIAQSNVAYILDQSQITMYPSKSERYRRALIYWNRAAIQGFHAARVKLGDYYFYGYGTEKSYETAATHYKHASDHSQNPQAMFNLAYMHEKGLGLKKDIHLAKRFYDLAAETSSDAQLPVNIVLFKIHLELLWEKWKGYSKSLFHFDSISLLNSYWDVYLMVVLGVLIGFLYTIRRQRANRPFIINDQPHVVQPPPAQPPLVQNMGQ